MDLESAIRKHSEWKTKFRTAIAKHESMDAASIARDDCCELGKWLHGAGKAQLGGVGAFGDCVRAHASFHSQAGKVASAINAKKYAEAEALLGIGTPYAEASSSVATAIMHLKRHSAQ